MVKFQRLVDRYVGTALIYFLKLFKREKSISSVNNVVFIKLWALGESVLTLPLIKNFKKRNSKSKIFVLCRKRNKAVYENLDYIDEIVLLEKDTLFDVFKSLNKYDLAFDLEPYLKIAALLSFWTSKRSIGFSHGPRSVLYDYRIFYDDRQHAVKNYYDMLAPLKAFGEELVYPENLEPLGFKKENKKVVDKFLKEINPKKHKVVGMTTTSAETSTNVRRWPAERFAKLADELIEKHKCIVLFPDAPNNKEYVSTVIGNMKHKKSAHELAGRFNLFEFFYLLGRCDVYVSNDTGPMHIAAAQGTNTIGLFGPNTPVRFGPYGKKNISLYNCKHDPYINPHLGTFDEPDHECMKNISVKEVLKAVESYLPK